LGAILIFIQGEKELKERESETKENKK